MDYVSRAREVFDIEIAGLTAVRDSLGEPFVELVELSRQTLARHGKLVLTGVGKSGHIGHKVAATLASTGTSSVFMHPVEAMHGDLGILDEHDMLICLSYSGETEELLDVLPAAKRFGVPVVAITGVVESRLGAWSDLVVPMTVPAEACPFNMAPTSSTTALLALGDALALVLMDANQFSKEDYGLRHPGGSIGRSVTLRIADIMRPQERTPVVRPDTLVKDALYAMSKCRSGSVLVSDQEDRLQGIFTDGDFRRQAQKDMNVLNRPIADVMTRNPISIGIDKMAVELLNLLESREIDDIPVIDANGKLAGLVDIQDLPKFKLM